MKKWKCTVCGYIHQGAEPPEKCPVCGADRLKFVEIMEPPGIGQDRPGRPMLAWALRRAGQLHLHPIAVHFPNGLLPVVVLFLFLSSIFRNASFGTAAWYNLTIVTLVMPVVLFSGYADWKKRFGGVLTGLFVTKMICGGVILILGPFLVFWHMIQPQAAYPDSGWRVLFLMLHGLLLGAAMLAGHLGGKLVFTDKAE